MSARVLLLTGPRPYQAYVAQRLCADLDVVQIVLEDASLRQPKTETVTARDRLRRISPGLFSLLARLKGLATKRRVERRAEALLERIEREARAEFEATIGGIPAWPDVPTMRVPRVNGKDVVRHCEELDVDVTLVFGTGILKSPMIRIARQATLNAHTSLLPDFRGTQSEFWQIHQDRLDCAGVTVHYIDEGVDTGEILLQKATAIEGRPDPARLRYHNVLMVPELFTDAVRQLEAGTAPRLVQEASEMPTYRTKDATFERQIEMLRRLGHDL